MSEYITALIGKRFGTRVIIGQNHRYKILVKCDCGVTAGVHAERFRRTGMPRCLACMPRHEPAPRLQRTKLERVWSCLRERCNNPRQKSWSRYGGRGITVCDEWKSWQVFRQWAIDSGYRDGLWIDRIDNDGPYSPDNCRWVTPKENCNNTRRNVSMTAFGETKTMAEWSRDPRCRCCYSTMYQRIDRLNWEPERAIVTPSLRR